jgi:hypothetical protein
MRCRHRWGQNPHSLPALHASCAPTTGNGCGIRPGSSGNGGCR